MHDKTSLVRQLIPTGYHFDGYNEINCQNSRDKPFFSDNVIQFSEHYHLAIQLVNRNTVTLNFSSVCANGEITFLPYTISLDEFVTMLQIAVSSNRDLVPFEISVKYPVHSNCSYCNQKNKDCSVLRKNKPEKIFAAVSLDYQEMKDALAMYFEIIPQKTSKGDSILMRKQSKFFGVNFEFGLSKDTSIASTLMGVAVKNQRNGNWYVYDAVNNTRKNLSNFKMGSFPLMLIPNKQYTVGHLYKEDGEYYYVRSVNSNGTVTLISATDGVIIEKLPEESLIPGLTFHTEVIAFDANSLMNANSKENVSGNLLAAMLMMQWSKGNDAEFSLDNLSDDSFNGMGSYLPMLLLGNGGSLGNMFTNPDGSVNIVAMMALGGMDGESGDMSQMMLLSQLMGNGTSPIADILSTASPAHSTSDAEKKVACEKCGSTYPEGTNFCPKCGGKLSKLRSYSYGKRCLLP